MNERIQIPAPNLRRDERNRHRLASEARRKEYGKGPGEDSQGPSRKAVRRR